MYFRDIKSASPIFRRTEDFKSVLRSRTVDIVGCGTNSSQEQLVLLEDSTNQWSTAVLYCMLYQIAHASSPKLIHERRKSHGPLAWAAESSPAPTAFRTLQYCQDSTINVGRPSE
jgi:hypothetical protein